MKINNAVDRPTEDSSDSTSLKINRRISKKPAKLNNKFSQIFHSDVSVRPVDLLTIEKDNARPLTVHYSLHFHF